MNKSSIQEFKEKYGFNTPTKGMPIDINNRDYYRSSIDPCNLYAQRQLIKKGHTLQHNNKKI